jgi:SAM-dependent methyltransferase
MAITQEQHNLEIHENREFWDRKAVLRRVYAQFYREIAGRLDPTTPGLVVELGSGLGNIKEHVPQCITTDIFPNPWLDRVENAYDLSFQDGAVGHLILFDVWHHLQYPGTALAEFARVLGPNGRIIVFEPAMGLVGRFVFGRFHHEPLGLGDEIRWEAPPGCSVRDCPYYAAVANASRVFGSGDFDDKFRGWRVLEIKYFSALAYVASGGFRGPQLYPAALLPCLNWMDSLLSTVPKLASRMLVVLEKAGVTAAGAR